MNIEEKIQEEYRDIKEEAEVKKTYLFPISYKKLKDLEK